MWFMWSAYAFCWDLGTLLVPVSTYPLWVPHILRSEVFKPGRTNSRTGLQLQITFWWQMCFSAWPLDFHLLVGFFSFFQHKGHTRPTEKWAAGELWLYRCGRLPEQSALWWGTIAELKINVRTSFPVVFCCAHGCAVVRWTQWLRLWGD